MKTMMTAVVKHGTRMDDTRVTQVAVPAVGAGDVLLRIRGVGLCGSDIHAWRGDPGYEWVTTPVVLGHEMLGEVAAVGSAVVGWQEGDRAAVISIQGCLACPWCVAGRTQRCVTRRVIGLSYDGGMAEYTRVPAEYLVPVPAAISDLVGAVIEPLSVAAHATLTTARVRAGESIVVSGAGFVGIACATLAQHAGAEVLLVGADRDAASRLPAARGLGLRTCTFAQAQWRRPDVWIEASGAPAALAAATAAVIEGGRIAAVGLYAGPPTADLNLLVRREITLNGCYASARSEYELVIDQLVKGDLVVESLLHPFDLADGVEAFATAARSEVLKPVLVPSG